MAEPDREPDDELVEVVAQLAAMQAEQQRMLTELVEMVSTLLDQVASLEPSADPLEAAVRNPQGGRDALLRNARQVRRQAKALRVAIEDGDRPSADGAPA
jgi:cob(I)alamin adenosyltransferase